MCSESSRVQDDLPEDLWDQLRERIRSFAAYWVDSKLADSIADQALADLKRSSGSDPAVYLDQAVLGLVARLPRERVLDRLVALVPALEWRTQVLLRAVLQNRSDEDLRGMLGAVDAEEVARRRHEALEDMLRVIEKGG